MVRSYDLESYFESLTLQGFQNNSFFRALAQAVDVKLRAGESIFDAFDFPILVGVHLLGWSVESQSPQVIAVGDF